MYFPAHDTDMPIYPDHAHCYLSLPAITIKQECLVYMLLATIINPNRQRGEARCNSKTDFLSTNPQQWFIQIHLSLRISD